MQFVVGERRVLVENQYFKVEYASFCEPRFMRATRTLESAASGRRPGKFAGHLAQSVSDLVDAMCNVVVIDCFF